MQASLHTQTTHFIILCIHIANYQNTFILPIASTNQSLHMTLSLCCCRGP